jgi:hypothetical protein
MTVHWNSRKGVAADSQTATSADAMTSDQQARLQLAELLWALRRTPDLRPALVHRGRKLIADPDYPPRGVIEAVARVLAGKLEPADPA